MAELVTWFCYSYEWVDCVWNVMAHAQKPDFVFRRNGRVHLKRRGRPFSRLLAAEVCASAGVMLNAPCCVVVWRVLATHSIRKFPLHFPSRASPCAITFQLDSTTWKRYSCSFPHQKGFVATLVLNLDTRWGWVVQFSPRSLYPRERNPVPVQYEAQRNPEPVWMF
jgi:hypothetical protein